MPGSILSGWREQYDRMLRSYFLLTTVAAGRQWASSDEARDAVVHFFQDAYHLKDWIKHDPGVTTSDVERLVTGSQPLRLCADLCNGTKHFGLGGKRKLPPRTGDKATAFTGQSVAVRPGVAGPGGGPEPALHSWMLSSGGVHYDAVALAGDVVNEWEDWLEREGLIIH
jgi:hypothetical protein